MAIPKGLSIAQITALLNALAKGKQVWAIVVGSAECRHSLHYIERGWLCADGSNQGSWWNSIANCIDERRASF